ncbi:MAG: hypothetical protein ACT4N8_06970 [Sphingosinicella sp.]|uniref:hypothetical protein n=1 Tax=Sphingosinicella sp. TaxID=1917971 RepID=UPI00403835E6
MRAWPLIASVLLAGCGDSGGNQAVSTEQIERVSTPKDELDDAGRSARLEPLSGDEIAEVGRDGGCVFSHGPDILLVAAGSNAIARVAGEARHFVQSAPVGPTGGFFEDRQVSISIGRVGAEGLEARATTTNRRSETSEEIAGTWTCEGMNR